MKPNLLADHNHRQLALDTNASFIVQAPAGSGKTEILTLRFLKLLATCEQPEQVLAITFTRKAANEMRRRIAAALQWAAAYPHSEPKALNDLQAQRLAIATTVLEQDKQYNWNLLENPARLRVQTIDSFCLYLANQLPVLSQLGGNPRVSEDVSPCFADAISNTLAQLESAGSISDDIAALLQHLDNDVAKVERLLIGLLHKRDQWLGHILEIKAAPTDAHLYLQQSLEELVVESLESARTGLRHHSSELIPLLNFAAANQTQAGKLTIPDFVQHQDLPLPSYSQMPYWQFLAGLVLTKKSNATEAPSWRRKVNVNNGFPCPDKAGKAQAPLFKLRKEAMTDLLKSLADDDNLLASLDYVRMLPDPALTPESWQFVAALTRVLAHLSSELLLSFRRFRVIDYAQVSSAARTALGDEENPTDLALALDHHIQHVLVDEFQDTSQMQMDILRQITAGWEPGDGRTLFLVGDAMQSCYAFRHANVGIYLQVRAHGLGNISLIPLTLQSNFRSQANIVTWVNQIFASAFPQRANISRGAVPYTNSVPVHSPVDDLVPQVTLLVHEPEEKELARQAEANAVVTKIQSLQLRYPTDSIAVLVRARTHLKHIIPALRAAGVQWQSTDIDRLTGLQVIEDLLTLTRAVLNLADRLAWLGLLRAPWCGLTIDSLHAVSSHGGAESIWKSLQKPENIVGLSIDARERLHGILPVLQYAMLNRYRVNLRSLLETSWRMLEGKAIAANQVELDCIAHYFNLISQHEVGFGIADIDQFSEIVAAAFVPNRSKADSATAPGIHLLTMHKAKGLEYDHVILPGLARKPPNDDAPLLQWHERLNSAGHSRLFLATLSPAGTEKNELFNLLRFEQNYRSTLESTRLLYIAATRARASVHLFATLERTASGKIIPNGASLLNRIWRELCAQPNHTEVIAVSAFADRSSTNSTIPQSDKDYPPQTPLRRLQHALTLSPLQQQNLQQLKLEINSQTDTDSQPFAIQKEAALGTVIHRSLEAIGKSGSLTLDQARLTTLRKRWQLQLRNLITQSELAHYLSLVETAVTNTLNNPSLHWVFLQDIKHSAFELALTQKREDGLHHYKIDRIAVDSAGICWIIDYKSALPAPQQDANEFIAEQSRQYSAQLHTYRNLYSQTQQRQLKIGLLFTSLGRLVELGQT